MWFVSKPPCKQTFSVLGTPGNGVDVQSANAHCEFGITSFASNWWTRRVISTVDPEARHGHKTAAHGFDGYKAHVAVDPDSEVICAAEVSVATAGDAVVAPSLLDDLTPDTQSGGQVAQAVVYGDSAYGTGTHLAWLNQHGLTPMVKAQHPTAPGGRFAKDQFRIDL